ncbi:ABC transporter permease [Rhizobium hainanense]|uniref:Simple sugar transport system permease protein n=1 Tax=Rhizobium hainanense TaxID=52131 RepID=A0A1C3WGH2_9HYPH|nr:ABC transporter permease [Rhizobium hainanense]SCB39157.1 simple sugar transport system permease protein [Rhizobium hainanense]
MSIELIGWGTLFGTLIAAILRASTPIILPALGGLVSDLAGSVNVALEGIMLIAAFFGVVASAYSAIWLPTVPTWIHPWVGLVAGLSAGVLVAGLLAMFHLELGADLIVAGIGINILAAGLTVFLLVSITGDKGSTATLTSFALPSLHIPFVDRIPVLDTILNGDGSAGHNIIVYVSLLAAPALAWLLYRTRFGLRLRAVGENRDAALAAGISVKRMQYAAVLLSGLLASLGGIFLGMGYLTLFQADMTGGRGFLALAAVFLGGRRPLGTLVAALVFGASTVFAARLGAYEIPSQVVFMIPPALTIIALVFFNIRRKRKIDRRISHVTATLPQAGKAKRGVAQS